jgi:uncharacterized protein (UPF0332 family)
MNPERFLDLARRLMEAGGPEDCRTAISRAYYAVFNVAEKLLARMNFHRPKRDYHPVLQKRLMASGDSALCRVGSDLGDLHEERVLADYHMQNKPPESRENAAAAVTKAEEMIGILNGCPINSERWRDAQANIARVNVTGTDHLAVAPEA